MSNSVPMWNQGSNHFFVRRGFDGHGVCRQSVQRPGLQLQAHHGTRHQINAKHFRACQLQAIVGQPGARSKSARPRERTSQSSWFGWLGAKDTKAAHDKLRGTSEIDMSATMTGEQHRPSRQGKRHNGVEPEEFVRGDGLARCSQQARPRMQQRRTTSPATAITRAGPPRKMAYDGTVPLPSEKYEASQPRDEARDRMARERQTYLSKQTKSLPPPRRSADANNPKRLAGEARRYFRQASKRSDASHSERREDLWPRQDR